MDIPKGKVKENLVYKNTPQRDLMLTFLPPTQRKYKKAPVYFIIPGGGWHIEDRQSMIDFSIKSVDTLRREGFAVVSIDYRVCGEGVVMSEIITDCFDATRYIAHFADTLEIDIDNFCFSGHSAGGHLALMLSYAPQDCFKSDYEFDDRFVVRAVAVMSAPTILYDDSTNNLRDLCDVFKGCDTKEEKEKMSPIYHVTSECPPTLLCAGTSDYLVFANSSERIFEKLTEYNVPCELKLSIGGWHSFEKIHNTIEPSITMEEMQSSITDFILQYVEKNDD